MKLEGKIIDFLGDSITEGVGVADCANCRFDNVLLRDAHLRAVHNYGVSGTRLSHQIVPSNKPQWDLCFCGRAYDLDPSADIIVVYGGVNDYIHGDAPIGKKGDTTPSTFCGAVYFLMNYLKERFPEKTVVFLTPARCCLDRKDTDLLPSPLHKDRPDAMPLLGYVDIILDTAKDFGIPVLDLYRDLGIDPNNKADMEAMTADGLHFNDAGHAVLAAKLKAFLEAL